MTSAQGITKLVGVGNLPAESLARASFRDVSYADHFAVRLQRPPDTSAPHDAERWARAVFGNTPSLGQRFIWTLLLGLPLSTGPASPDAIAGWRIGARSPTWIRLENRSWLMSANMVVAVEDGSLSLATIIKYESRICGLWWPALANVHRYLVPRILRRALARPENQKRK